MSNEEVIEAIETYGFDVHAYINASDVEDDDLRDLINDHAVLTFEIKDHLGI